MALSFVAFDIETTGFAVGDALTVAGFALTEGCRVCLNTGGRAAPELEARVRDRVGDHGAVDLSTHEDERALLAGVAEFAGERLGDEEAAIVAYNGETWQGGFDLPFLRSRAARLEMGWPFAGLPYVDVMPVVTRRFNTQVAGEDGARQDLAGVYEALVGGALGGLDPFPESDAAVGAYREAAFADLVVHNVADILRTQALAALAREYCSKSDTSMKSLTPISHD